MFVGIYYSIRSTFTISFPGNLFTPQIPCPQLHTGSFQQQAMLKIQLFQLAPLLCRFRDVHRRTNQPAGLALVVQQLLIHIQYMFAPISQYQMLKGVRLAGTYRFPVCLLKGRTNFGRQNTCVLPDQVVLRDTI